MQEESQPFVGTQYNTFGSGSNMDDLVKRDKKEMVFARLSHVFPHFLMYLFIVLPIWLFCLLPLTLMCFPFKLLYGLIVPSSTDKSNDLKYSNVTTISSKVERFYDVVVFGATGFTGRLAVKYIAKQYGAQFKWAIAGRNKGQLEALKKELTEINPACTVVPIIIADVGDLQSLQAMVASTSVIISTVGPFAKYGSDLVRFCSDLGTHYCDITGEVDWVRTMIDLYDDRAKSSGARIVHCCGHDSVPWDMLVLSCANQLKSKNEELREINIYDEARGSASGGTISTIFYSLENRVQYKSMLGFDPLLKSLSSSKSSNKMVINNTMFLRYSKEFKSWCGPFIMASVNANCIKRSNAINNYSTSFKYDEALLYPSFFAGFVNVMQLILFVTLLSCPPLAYIMKAYVLPKPGEGPSAEEMSKSYLNITAIAKGSHNSTVSAMIYFPDDPGYKETARMVVESALTLLYEKNNIKVGGGVFTPASCQGNLLVKRLVDTGAYFIPMDQLRS